MILRISARLFQFRYCIELIFSTVYYIIILQDEPSHPSSVEEQNDEDSSLDNFPYLSETNINFVLSAKEHGIF